MDSIVPALTYRLKNASTRWRSAPVMKPLHAGDAYVSLETTTALNTVYRLAASFMPWWRRTRRAYSVCALSDIYVCQPMNETFYSSISDQSTGLLGLLPGTVTLMMMMMKQNDRAC